ncbi:MAG TPA: hypothetical protein VJ765_00005 [Chitinophagaceae bacterium]|nr:hypothetical protein [Chitinophagaceae bacterium]
MSWKKIFVAGGSLFLTGLLIVLVYVYKEYNRRPADPSTQKADFETDYKLILDEFLRNEQLATSKYTGKVISINGRIKTWEDDYKGKHCFVVFGEMDGAAMIRCSMDTVYCNTRIEAGTFMVVKGVCIGFNRDDLLGSDLVLNRCVITKQ